MSEIPLVSIGVPVYNGELYLGKALDSLLLQDHKNIEIIISDNCSTDRTKDICMQYQAVDNRISIITQKVNIGLMNNFKAVLESARGDYFMWAAVDDYWYPEFVSLLVNDLVEHEKAGVAMCAVDRTRSDGSKLDSISFKGKNSPNNKTFLPMALALLSPKKYNLFIYGVFRTKLLRSAIRFWPTVASSDRWLLLQLSLATKFRYVDQMLHVRIAHDDPYHMRYPLDEFGRNKIISESKRLDFQPLWIVLNMVLRSPIIPLFRKMYLLIILPSMLLRIFRPYFLNIIRKDYSLTEKKYISIWLEYTLSKVLRGLIICFFPRVIRRKIFGEK